MYSNDELETILIRAIGSHQSLDMKKHLIEAVTKVFDKLETCEDELSEIKRKYVSDCIR